MHRFRLLPLLLLVATTVLHAAPPPAVDLPAARALFTARRDAEAQSALDHLLLADPTNHEAVYLLGRLAKRRSDWKTVAERYERCTQLAPTVALYWADLGEAYGKLTNKAGVFHQLGLARKCRAALERAVALAPTELEYRRGLIEFYEQAPFVAGGGRDKALAQAAAIAAHDPYASALATGGIHARAKNWAEAEQAFRSAASLRPESTEPEAALGLLFADQGRHAEAFAAFDRVLAREPGNLVALYQLGRVAAISGQRLPDGEAALRRYLEQPTHPAGQPTNAHAQYRLGELLARRGDTAGARAAFEAALRLDPGLKPAAEALRRLAP
ncbi:MAG TPA: tetratricopeptide repeat protein [Opitutaceae bacterium]|nr:tetratricopeptide repeat protein [Opitutaceae bacterium]